MTPAKRVFDLAVAGLAVLLLWPVALLAALAILVVDGPPVLYRGRRMRDPARAFDQWKFRTMRPERGDGGVTGGDKADRITTTGRLLRATRLDELPQLVNVLRGDMSLVGPRPPLPLYVEARPDLYAEVLACRPGLTGLATLVYHRHEARLLRDCASPGETHETYLRRCVPAKARLDLIYRRNRNLCLDAWILLRTVAALPRRR